jgi:dienelactone hydrolase
MTLQHDGAELVGQAALPHAQGRRPAVLVMHNAHGLGPHVCERASRLADLGYVAVATDMYGGGVHHTDPNDSGRSMMRSFSEPDLLRARAVAWFEAVKNRSDVDPQRVAAIGFCFGGMCALELARSGADVKAAVSFHGLLSTPTPAAPGAVTGDVAIYAGAKDPFAPPEQVAAVREEMTTAGARLQITVFENACHGFTDPDSGAMRRDGIAYDATADRVSWASTLALLDITIGD